MYSFTVRTMSGIAGPAASARPERATIWIGMKSVSGSYESFLKLCGYTVIRKSGVKSSVVPSGSAFFTASTPVRPEAPTLFSTITAGA